MERPNEVSDGRFKAVTPEQRGPAAVTPGSVATTKSAEDIKAAQIEEAKASDAEYEGKSPVDGREVRGSIRTFNDAGAFEKKVVAFVEEPKSGSEEVPAPPAPEQADDQ